MGDIDKEGETNTARHPSNLHSTIGAPTKSPDAVKFHIQPPEKPYTRSDFQLEDRHIDRGRPLRVAVIGAGLSGVLAGAILPPKVPGIKLVIFEKNTDVVSYQSTIGYQTVWLMPEGWYLARKCLPGGTM